MSGRCPHLAVECHGEQPTQRAYQPPPVSVEAFVDGCLHYAHTRRPAIGLRDEAAAPRCWLNRYDNAMRTRTAPASSERWPVALPGAKYRRVGLSGRVDDYRLGVVGADP